jgi:hypothetical protein
MSDTQSYNQALGPHRPLPRVLASMLDSIPKHMEIEAISINGQTGTIIVECYHELAKFNFEFQTPETKVT